jgi:hypothetical protein
MQSDKAGGSAKLPNCSDASGIAAVLYNDRVSGGGESVLHEGAGWRHKSVLVPVPAAVAVVSWITRCHRCAACRQREHARDHDKYEAFSGHG